MSQNNMTHLALKITCNRFSTERIRRIRIDTADTLAPYPFNPSFGVVKVMYVQDSIPLIGRIYRYNNGVKEVQVEAADSCAEV